MAAMFHDSTAVVVVRTRPRAIPLAMIHMKKSIHGFPLVSLYGYGLPLAAFGRRSSAIEHIMELGRTKGFRLIRLNARG